jgi:hypothetical protein
MPPISPHDVVLRFEEVINSHSAEAISSMMTTDGAKAAMPSAAAQAAAMVVMVGI